MSKSSFTIIALIVSCLSSFAVGPTPAPKGPVARDLSDYRKQYPTKLTVEGPSPKSWQDPRPLEKPADVDEITYDSSDLKLKAWISKVPDDGKLHPAIVFCHGGFWFGTEDWTILKPLLDAGFVLMTPTLRGENGNPGHFEYYYGEVDDIVAAGKYVAAAKGVDKSRVFVSGHSAGGDLAALAVMKADQPFAMSAPIGATLDMRIMSKAADQRHKDLIVFDPNDIHEVEARSAVLFTASLRAPIILFHGDKDSLAKTQQQFITLASIFKKEASLTVVPGNHSESLPASLPRIVSVFQDFNPKTDAK